MDNPREFFETLESRVDPSKAAGLTAKYLFEIDGAGNWTVDVDDGKVSVSENGGDADCTISASSETFMQIASCGALHRIECAAGFGFGNPGMQSHASS